MNTIFDRRQALGLMAGTALTPLMPAALASEADWKPSDMIRYVIGVAPGGSVDLYARGIKSALEKMQLLHGQSVLADNKPGAAGLLGLQQLQRNRGNAHHLGTFHTGSIAGQVTGILKADMREFVPVAMLVEETSLVAVRADSPLRNIQDLLARLKQDPGSVSFAVAPTRGLNTHLAIAKPLKVAGVAVDKLTVVPFRSSGESMTALLGGNVDVVSATSPTVMPQVQAGKVRVLASAAPRRGTGPMAGIPTWREQGVAADFVSYNGILLGPNSTPAQIAFWEDALRKVSQQPAWQALVERNGGRPVFRNAAESMQYMVSEQQSITALVQEMGLVAK